MSRFALLVPLLLVGLSACGFGGDPKQGIRVAVESPAEVAAGENFEIRAVINNDGEKAAVLDSIDIGDSYLKGILIDSSVPAFGDTMHVPIDNTLSHDFQAPVPAGGTLTVIFTARAAQTGTFSGDFDICVNSVYDCFFEQISTSAR